MFKEEPNSRIHAFVAVLSILTGIILEINSIEWIAIILCIGFVLAIELINSSVENLADFVCSEKRNAIKKVKDLAAAGVLVSAFSAAAVGLVIFIPKILDLIANFQTQS